MGREIQLAEAGLARIRLVGGGRAFDVQEVLHPANSRDATYVALEDLDLLGLLDLAAEHDHAASHIEVDVALGDLRIPEDLALATFDDAYFAELLAPPLTAVAYDPSDVGEQAAALLIEAIRDGDSPPRVVTVPVALVTRRSLRYTRN